VDAHQADDADAQAGFLLRLARCRDRRFLAVLAVTAGHLPAGRPGAQLHEDRARLHDGHLRAVHRPADAIDLDEWSLHPNSVKTLGSGRNSGVTPGSTACE